MTAPDRHFIVIRDRLDRIKRREAKLAEALALAKARREAAEARLREAAGKVSRCT